MNDFIINTNVETLSPKVEVLMLKGEPGSGGGGDPTDYVTKSGLSQTTGTATDNTMSQNAITNALSGKANTSDLPVIVQSTGNSTTNVMSQDAVTTALNGKANTNDIPTVPTNVSAFTNDAGYLTSHQDISGKENTSNKVTSLSSSSTDSQYPSAKCVYDLIGNINTILATLTTPVGGSV